VLAIGEFSRLTHLSVRTLRRYHDAGLLEPATVDDASGYRYYTADQIPAAQVIHRLRELDVPLSDVQRILRSPDPRARATLVADHLHRLESELDRTRAAVASLRRLLRPEPAPLDVELRAVPATTVAAVEDDVAHDEVLAWYAGAMAELGAWVVANALAVAGPVRETYLVGPRDTADPAARRTEIGWPVFRVAPR
jgi:DNA-binding transcriptional MerR regulator